MKLYIKEFTLDELRLMLDRDLNDDRINWRDRASFTEKDNNNQWTGGMSLSQASDALVHGWDAHRAQMSEETERLLTQLQEEVNDYIGTHHREVKDVSGGYIDMDRYLLGEPECMVESWMDESVLHGKAIKVLVNCAATSNVRAEALIERGAAVVAAVDAVLASGMNVELWVGEAISSMLGDKEVLVDLLCVKEYNDLIDPDVLAFTTAHPAMLRRIFFYMNEQHDSRERKLFGIGPEGGSYGRPTDMPQEVKESFDLVIERYRHGDEVDPEQVYRQMMRVENRASEYV